MPWFGRAALVLCISLLALAPAGAASFDCATARAPDETAICGNCELAQLDVKMATLYDVLTRLVAMGTRGALRDAQSDWLRHRASCGADTTCLVQAYRTRIGLLEKEFEAIYSRGPF